MVQPTKIDLNFLKIVTRGTTMRRELDIEGPMANKTYNNDDGGFIVVQPNSNPKNLLLRKKEVHFLHVSKFNCYSHA